MLSKPLLRCAIHFQPNAACVKTLLDVFQTQVDDRQDRLLRELVKDLQGVETVEELWREEFLRSLNDFLFGFGGDNAGSGVGCGGVSEDVAAQVAGQADNRVLNIRG